MAIHSPSEQAYIVASGLTNLRVPSFLSLQSSGSSVLTMLKSLDAEFSSLHDVVLMANAAHKTAIDRCLIFNDNSFYRFCGANNTKICLRSAAVFFAFFH